MTGRNDPCHCGSGKKFKACCIDKPVDYGNCHACEDPETSEEMGVAPGGSDIRAIGKQFCKICSKEYPFCRAHQADMQNAMRGHVMRVHPETIPGLIDRLSPRDMAMIREQHALEPELWQRLIDFIAGRKGRLN